jgi:pantothenate kinase type III
MNLIIDQGNTATKMAIFDENDLLVKKVSFDQENVVKIENWIETRKKNQSQKSSFLTLRIPF